MGKYKPNLKEFNDRPDLIFVINRFNYVEYILNKIIASYINPPQGRQNFVQTVLLNTAIISFGSKLKLFLHMNATEEWTKLDSNKFHRLAQIRNQFAHSGKQHITLDLDIDTGECTSENYLVLESVAGSGKLEEIDSEVALDEFAQIFEEIKQILHDILNKLEND
jgi:hypothetical protein